jgi:hypothetical protein
MIVLLVYANQTSRKEKFNVQSTVEKSKTECAEKCSATCQKDPGCMKDCTTKCEQDSAQVKMKNATDCPENHKDCQKMRAEGKCPGHTSGK